MGCHERANEMTKLHPDRLKGLIYLLEQRLQELKEQYKT